MREKFKSRSKQESGQIIVLLAISLLVLIIVSALAVDGGMIYSERRYVQNAADAASLAGGGAVLNYMESVTDGIRNVTKTTFSCSDSLINRAKSEAISVAGINNFSIPYLGKIVDGVVTTYDGHDINENHGVVIVCNSNKKFIDTEVRITSSISTAFAHLIFPDNLVTTNLAVSEATPRGPYAKGNAIVSMNTECQANQEGMYFSGTATVLVDGGSIHSESCLDGNGTISVIAEDGTITLVEDWNSENKPSFSPEPDGGVETIGEINIPEPPCEGSDKGFYKITGGEDIILPGNYTGISMTGGNLKFTKGIYCLTGDLEITGGHANGDGVTFYMKPDLSLPNNPKTSNVKITGGALVELAAPLYDPDDPTKESVTFGILFYMDKLNPGVITLVGNDDSFFSGTIYAPTGTISIGGTSDTDTYEETLQCLKSETDPSKCQAVVFSTQLIGLNVKISGTSGIAIFYDESTSAQDPGQLMLLK
jgi:hypothetical protein